MSEEEREESVSESAAASTVSESKPLPIKWIMIGLGGLFLIEIIVGVVLYLTKGTASADPHALASPSSSPMAHASPAAGEGHGSGEHTAEVSTGETSGHADGHTDAHSADHAAPQPSAGVYAGPPLPVNSGEGQHSDGHGDVVSIDHSADETHASDTQTATSQPVALRPTPTPVVRLDQVQFPSLTIPPDGEIRVDLKDAGKLLDILLAE